MGTLFSRQCEYALQAVLYLALKPKDKKTSIREIAETLSVPYHFLAKILQRLTHYGLLKSHKGTSGGFALDMPSGNITLLHIIHAIDGDGFLSNCVLGFPECSSDNPCAMHAQWEKSRDNILNLLGNKTIDQMARSMKKSQYLVEQ